MSHGKGLGFIPGSEDERDYRLKGFIDRMAAPQIRGSQFWYGIDVLDQGSEGACVGFSWTQRQNSAPKIKRYDNDFAFSLYHRAQELDEWEGSDYEGTSVRAGGLAAVEKGLISGFAYAQDAEELATWILNKGPCVIGIDWYEGMDNVKSNSYFVTPTGQVRGGHAIEVDGVRWQGKSDYFRLRNSWGSDWGYWGRCKVTVEDMEKLLSDRNAAAATAVEL